RVKGAILSTLDGGNSWQPSELSFVPNSFFALDDSFLWAVSDRGEIWSSAESGKDWKKLTRKENALRVHFLDAQRGFLVGRKKTLMRTEDGGKTWAHVPEAAQVLGDADDFVYRRADFWNGKIGIVSGGIEEEETRPRRRGADLPAWMEPEVAGFRGSSPHVMVNLETRDGGKTWTKQEVSGFGYLHRAVIGSDGQGLSLIKFSKSFTYGGELYSFHANGKKGELIIRTKELELQDIVYIPGDGAYLACTERLGILPVPTKVRIKYSKDLKTWVDLQVDYRAAAQSVVLSSTPSGKVFAALDQGTILALQ
ncbi:MAG: YCF48-related protein, partial [Chloroflexia bacterium]